MPAMTPIGSSQPKMRSRTTVDSIRPENSTLWASSSRRRALSSVPGMRTTTKRTPGVQPVRRVSHWGPGARRVRDRLLEDAPDLALAEGDPGHAILAHPLHQAAHRDLLRLGREEPALEEDENDDSDGNVENGEACLLANAGFHRRITAEKCYRRGQPLSNRGPADPSGPGRAALLDDGVRSVAHRRRDGEADLPGHEEVEDEGDLVVVLDRDVLLELDLRRRLAARRRLEVAASPRTPGGTPPGSPGSGPHRGVVRRGPLSL